MVSNFSTDYIGLYINWAKTYLFIILGKLPTLNLRIKSHTSLRSLNFFDEILVSNYHGCKGEAINWIPRYMIDIIYKTVKPSLLEKLQMIKNINKLMKFQVTFIFSVWLLIKQIIVFSTLFYCWGEKISKKFCLDFWIGNESTNKNF